ncbi:hypothetical protein PR048_004999 [Dryococelus australis]|uniref:Uncharacterized protein n=1 Tax=Dryococelus australis TaxID=614101 RepID=A0ABQ9I812_9NEOP|nr:hypothetical protein PR048_004999 [Dryococelus australis]
MSRQSAMFYSPPSAFTHSRIHSPGFTLSLSRPLAPRTLVCRRRPAPIFTRALPDSMYAKECRPLDRGSIYSVVGCHQESSQTRALRRGGLWRRPVSKEYSSIVPTFIGISSRREEVCGASKSHRCQYSRASQKTRQQAASSSFQEEGRFEVGSPLPFPQHRTAFRRQLQRLYSRPVADEKSSMFIMKYDDLPPPPPRDGSIKPDPPAFDISAKGTKTYFIWDRGASARRRKHPRFPPPLSVGRRVFVRRLRQLAVTCSSEQQDMDATSASSFPSRIQSPARSYPMLESDEALSVRVSVARIAPSLLDLERAEMLEVIENGLYQRAETKELVWGGAYVRGGSNGTEILPCENAVGYIIPLHQENRGCHSVFCYESAPIFMMTGDDITKRIFTDVRSPFCKTLFADLLLNLNRLPPPPPPLTIAKLPTPGNIQANPSNAAITILAQQNSSNTICMWFLPAVHTQSLEAWRRVQGTLFHVVRNEHNTIQYNTTQHTERAPRFENSESTQSSVKFCRALRSLLRKATISNCENVPQSGYYGKKTFPIYLSQRYLTTGISVCRPYFVFSHNGLSVAWRNEVTKAGCHVGCELMQWFKVAQRKFWTALNIEVLRVKRGEHGAAAECKGGGKRDISEKTCRPVVSSDTIPTCENPGATPPGTLTPTRHLTSRIWKLLLSIAVVVLLREGGPSLAVVARQPSAVTRARVDRNGTAMECREVETGVPRENQTRQRQRPPSFTLAEMRVSPRWKRARFAMLAGEYHCTELHHRCFPLFSTPEAEKRGIGSMPHSHTRTQGHGAQTPGAVHALSFRSVGGHIGSKWLHNERRLVLIEEYAVECARKLRRSAFHVLALDYFPANSTIQNNETRI